VHAGKFIYISFEIDLFNAAYRRQQGRMKTSVNHSEVFVASHRLDGDETNNNTGATYGVIVRNANKTYGVGSNRYAILNRLNMTVKKGTM
jgi:hypothetical protein